MLRGHALDSPHLALYAPDHRKVVPRAVELLVDKSCRRTQNDNVEFADGH